MNEKPSLFIQIGMLITYLGTVTVNALANILPINGNLTEEVSDSLPDLFAPAGITFAIWGVIYLLLGAFTIYSVFNWFSKKDIDLTHVSLIGIPFIISNLMNLSWIFFWHYELIGLSLIAMLILLGSLIYSYEQLYRWDKKPEPRQHWLVFVPISVYYGWITVATIANVTAFLVDINWNAFGLSEPFWTILVIIVGTGITIAIIFTRKNFSYTFVVLWAYFGIILKRTNPAFEPHPEIVITTIIMMVLIVIADIIVFLKKKSE